MSFLLSFLQIIFLLFADHISPNTHQLQLFLVKYFQAICLDRVGELTVKVETDCGVWFSKVVPATDWSQSIDWKICFAKELYSKLSNRFSALFMDITVYYTVQAFNWEVLYFVAVSILPSCDFVFSGIFDCDVAHNKRAIKSVLVLLLRDDLQVLKLMNLRWRSVRVNLKERVHDEMTERIFER